MNLRGIANNLTQAINPNIAAVVRASNGYTTDAAYKQVPTYAADAPATVQIQALTRKEVEHLDAMNLSQATRAVYANRQLHGIDRATQRGGDLLLFNDPETGEPSTWLVVAVLEGWGMSGWCKAAIAKQNDA